MEFWKGLPTWAKGVIAVTGTAMTVFISYKVYKKIKELKAEKKGKEETKTITNELNQLVGKETYPPSQYMTWAGQLQEAFDGCGTTWGTVKGIFSKLNNDADYLKLVSVYGIRMFDACGLWTGDFKGTLTQALESELDTSEKEELNKILSSKNIKYSI